MYKKIRKFTGGQAPVIAVTKNNHSPVILWISVI